MIAIVVQYKDMKGTLLVLQPPSSKTNYEMEVVQKIETLIQSFTTLAVSVIQQEGDDQSRKIIIAIPKHEKINIAKIFMLNDTA